VVPGVTSSVAAPAYAGIPVTHRDFSSSVAIVTGHRQSGKEEERVPVPDTDTIVYLMGVTNISNITGALIESGRSPQTPVAVIRWGTRPQQRTVVGNLEDIAGLAERERINPPAVIVVGEVVRLRDKLNWFEQRPDWRDELPAGDAVPFPGPKASSPSGTEPVE
jgi:uroporphyrinogen III methyltransferase/synthase